MFNNTLKQLKIIGKENLAILTSIKNDICQEIKISKQVKAYRKELISKQNTSDSDATRAHEETQS
jgi:predicted ribonuclease toxin of YeeF-YezG toxin-antitoxin module